MRPRRSIVLGLAMLAAPAFTQEGQKESPLTAPPPGVSLTGYWRLDPRLSDDPGDKVQEAMKGLQTEQGPRQPAPVIPTPGGYPPGRYPPGGREGERTPVPTGPGIDVTTPGVTGDAPGGDPFGRGGGGRSSYSQSRAAFEHVLDLPETLRIAQRPSMILIEENDDEGRTRILRPDGARHQSTGGQSENRTRWEKGQLHVETWHDDGVKVEEFFELAPDASLLTVSVRVGEGGAAIALERVFRPQPSDES